MSRPFPTKLEELESWGRAQRVPAHTSRARLAQFAVLKCIAHSELGAQCALKGGNALRVLRSNPRGTLDLDFTSEPTVPDGAEQIRALVDDAVRAAFDLFAIKMRCQSIKRNPRGPGGTHPTYAAKVGFVLPLDRSYADFEQSDVPVAQVVKLEISLNDVVCETDEVRVVQADLAGLRCCSLEDVLGEKLRSLLQQKIRNRHRPQDLYDLARTFLDDPSIDTDKIREFFVRKARARGIEVRRSEFDRETKSRAQAGFDELNDVEEGFELDPEVAWRTLEALLDQLEIPD